MKIAIMQPYYFPYAGYFDLISNVDVFVLLDDVQYIRRGWVNRNKLLSCHGSPKYITVPVVSHSRIELINRIKIDGWGWHKKHIRAMTSYRGASKLRIVQELSSFSPTSSLCDFLEKTLSIVSYSIGIRTPFLKSSSLKVEGRAEERILNICEKLGADEYWNLSGGGFLYDQQNFKNRGIKLFFSNPPNSCMNFSILHDIFMGKYDNALR